MGFISNIIPRPRKFLSEQTQQVTTPMIALGGSGQTQVSSQYLAPSNF